MKYFKILTYILERKLNVGTHWKRRNGIRSRERENYLSKTRKPRKFSPWYVKQRERSERKLKINLGECEISLKNVGIKKSLSSFLNAEKFRENLKLAEISLYKTQKIKKILFSNEVQTAPNILRHIYITNWIVVFSFKNFLLKNNGLLSNLLWDNHFF